MTTLDWNKLILTSTFYIYYFLLSWRMQNENLESNSHKNLYVLLNTNQIKLDTYTDLLKENPLLKKFLNSGSTACFLDHIIYHTPLYHILLFSITTATVIKATKYSTYYIIHNSHYVATKYSIISTETCKVILPGW